MHDSPDETGIATDGRPRLRAPQAAEPFHVVLVEPEIPPNVGAVGRSCAATGSPLHLVGPLHFDLSERAVRRAGLDYWPLIQLHTYADRAAFLAAVPRERLRPFLVDSPHSLYATPPRPGDYLVFGKESTGLEDWWSDTLADQALAIPMPGQVRSLNLATASALAVYEGLRASGSLNAAALAR